MPFSHSQKLLIILLNESGFQFAARVRDCVHWLFKLMLSKMKIRILSAAVVFVAGTCFFACDREEEISGCTHHLAENHDPRATVDDGSCTYSEDSQLIWKDGVPGGWNGNLTTYGFIPQVCIGSMTAEVDTSNGGAAPARLMTDSNGDLEVQFKLVNPRTARNYIEGFIHFQILVPEDVELSTFQIYTHGKMVGHVGSCGEFIRSQPIQLSAAALGSENFTTVSVPFRDFGQLMLADIRVVFGLSIEGAVPDSEVLHLNNIRWTRF